MLFLLYFLNFFNYYYLKPPGSVAGEVVVNKRALFWAKKMGVWCFYSLSPLSSSTPSGDTWAWEGALPIWGHPDHPQKGATASLWGF